MYGATRSRCAGDQSPAAKARKRRTEMPASSVIAAQAADFASVTEAKSAACAAMTEDAGISVRRFRAFAAGLWSPAQRDLVAPYIAAYVAVAPSLAWRRSALAASAGRAC